MITYLIDLRTQYGPVRDQLTRPTCLAFTLSDLNANGHGRPSDLSPEYLYRESALITPGWLPDRGTSLDAALIAVNSPGQPLETHCPYQRFEPTLPLASVAIGAPLFSGTYRKLPVQAATIASELMRNGRSVGLVIRLTTDFYYPHKADATIEFSPSFINGGVHAVLAIGIGQDTKTAEQHFLIRNSWGGSWGDNGYAWLPERYVNTHALAIFGA